MMMITNKTWALLFILGAGSISGVLYQNMTPVEFSALNIPQIDEKSRRDQAKELLGTYYTGSPIQSLDGHRDLNYLVYKKLENSLSSEWKGWLPQITKELIKECQRQDMDPIFVMAIIQTESQWNTYAKGTSGEIGLMQILPQTATWIAKKYRLEYRGESSLYDPITNLKIGITYFAHLRSQFESRAHHYVPAYNMGPTNLRRVARSFASIGTDERDLLYGEYGSKVMRNYRLIYNQLLNKDALVRFAQKTESSDSTTGSLIQ
jgi:Soluble lytic murein transglycosylase and related regulatory proteins (some contain LysM/invasin domains)